MHWPWLCLWGWRWKDGGWSCACGAEQRGTGDRPSKRLTAHGGGGAAGLDGTSRAPQRRSYDTPHSHDDCMQMNQGNHRARESKRSKLKKLAAVPRRQQQRSKRRDANLCRRVLNMTHGCCLFNQLKLNRTMKILLGARARAIGAAASALPRRSRTSSSSRSRRLSCG